MLMLTALPQYEIPKLADDAYATAGKVLSQITTAEVGLHVLRDLSDKQSAKGALQRTIIDRLLTLIPRDVSMRGAGNKRRREEDAATPSATAPAGEHYPNVIRVPLKKSGRAKTPTLKAKEYVRSHSIATVPC